MYPYHISWYCSEPITRLVIRLMSVVMFYDNPTCTLIIYSGIAQRQSPDWWLDSWVLSCFMITPHVPLSYIVILLRANHQTHPIWWSYSGPISTKVHLLTSNQIPRDIWWSLKTMWPQRPYKNEELPVFAHNLCYQHRVHILPSWVGVI